jgi:hypothetical protein
MTNVVPTLTATALMVATVGISSGTAQIIDQGVLEIRRNNRIVGEETFRIERTEQRGVAVTIHSTARYRDDNNTELLALIELDRDGQPVAAQFDNSGPPAERAVVTLDARVVSYRILSPAGDNWGGTFRRPAGIVFWMANQFAPYLVAPVPGTGIRGVDIHDRELRDVQISDLGEVSETIRGETVQARLFSAVADGEEIKLWYVQNRLMKVEIPALSILAVRRATR